MNGLDSRVVPDAVESRGWPQRIAMAGLFALAAGISGAKALQSLGILLVIVGTLAVLPEVLKRLKRDRLTVAVLLFFAYLLIGALIAPNPSYVEVAHWDLVRKMARVLLLPMVAYWLAGREDRIAWLLGCALLGTIAVLVEQWVSWGTLSPMFTGERTGFGLNPIWMGLNASLLLLGIVGLRGRLVSGIGRRLRLTGAGILWLLLLLLFVQVVIVSQSRGVYMALVAGGMCLAYLWRDRTAFCGALRNRWNVAATLVAAGLILGVVLIQADVLAKRFVQEQTTIASVFDGSVEAVPMTPIGQRVHMYVAAVDAWAERPWLGWGPDGSRIAIARGDLPGGMVRDHLHNGPLDALVRFGVLGAALFYAILAIIVRASWRDLTTGRVAHDIGSFLLAGLVTLAVADLTESYIASGHGWSLLVLLGGCMYTRHLWFGRGANGAPSGEGKGAARTP